jgi:hypothetical protein
MKLAYLYYLNDEENYRGGVLLTDEKTKPLEFRITSKVKLEELQKILYGSSLKEVLFKEKFGIELLSIREKISAPIIYIRKFDPFMPKDRLSHKVINIQEKFEPLIFTISKEDEDKLISVSKKLNDIYRNFNILEPFSRVEKAMEYLKYYEGR